MTLRAKLLLAQAPLAAGLALLGLVALTTFLAALYLTTPFSFEGLDLDLHSIIELLEAATRQLAELRRHQRHQHDAEVLVSARRGCMPSRNRLFRFH